MQSIRALVVCLVAAAAMLAAGGSLAAVFNPQSFTLSNGMQVVVIPNHRAPIVAHMVWYRVGAADEPIGKSGIAHFLEHLMFKGTEKVPSGEFSRIVARNGGNDNAFTSHDYTAYFQRVARDKLELVMKLEADRMTNLTLTDAEVLPERDVVVEERRSRTDNDPAAQLHEAVRATLYFNHPYRIPIIGWKHEIEKLTTKDALSFYRKYYVPNNAILIVAGDVTAEQLRPLAEKYYGAIEKGAAVQRHRVKEPPHLAARRVELQSARVGLPRWSRSYIAPSYNTAEGSEAYALQVLAETIGGSSLSRLYRTLVVEQSIAASVGAWYSPNNLDLGTFVLSVTPRAGIDIAKAEAALLAEVERVLKDGVTEEEIARAKRSLVASAVYARDSLATAPNVIGAALTTGSAIEDVEAWPERIEAVTVEQVNEAARSVLIPARSVTGVLRPQTLARD